jgi:hypothetical protein
MMFERGQIWEPDNEPGRKIVSVDATIDLLTWTSPTQARPGRTRRFHDCRISAFKAWVKRTGAELFTGN